MDELLRYIISKIVLDEGAISISRDETEEAIIFNIGVDEADYGKLIGRSGKTINAIRYLLVLCMSRQEPETRKRIYLKLQDSQ